MSTRVGVFHQSEMATIRIRSTARARRGRKNFIDANRSVSHACAQSEEIVRTTERTVGAALRGRPRLEIVFANRRPSFFGVVFKPRAATEGRPYSTFRELWFP